MTKLGVPGTLFAVLLLSGCVSADIEKDAKYKDVLDLRAAYVASGAVKDPDCDDAITQDALSQWGWQSINCGPHTSLVHFNSQTSLDDFMERNPVDQDELHIVGPNWLIDAPQFEAEEVQKQLGGTPR